MDIEIIAIRISQCIDDLSLLLDQIYKFPQKQREAYFQKIQSMKNKLLMLKSNLRDGNAVNTQKQYKQIYLSMNGLKNEIAMQSSVLQVTKENRDVHNRGKDIKEVKRNYEDAMKLILEKDDEISMLRKELYEKEQLVKMNFQELHSLKADLEIVLEENRLLKFEHTSLQIDLESAKASIGRTSDVAIQYKIRQQQKDKVFHSALDQLDRLKGELINANQKINHFEQLAEISIKKTKLVEENIKKVERQAQGLNENYRMKENQNFKKLRQLGELEFQINNRTEHIKQLEHQNRRLREDLQVLENQIHKLNKVSAEQRIYTNEEKEKLYQEQKRLNAEIENGLAREGDLKRVIEESEKKYLIVINKLNVAEELKVRNRELQIKNESLDERLKKVEQLLEEAKRQNLILLKEKERLVDQLDHQMRSTRQIQIQNFKFREKVKLKDDQKLRLIQDLDIYQNKLKQSERALAMHEVSYQSMQSQIIEEKTKLIKFEQKQRIKEKQIENLKVKLLQAKIQTIHEIREVIN